MLRFQIVILSYNKTNSEKFTNKLLVGSNVVDTFL